MKNVFVLAMLLAFSLVFAELIIDVPFDQNIVGQSYFVNGSYNYETDWITMTNSSNETETFTVNYSFSDLPPDWNFQIGSSAFFFNPDYDFPILLGPGDSEQIYAHFNVTSMGGFSFSITFDESEGGGDREGEQIFNFTFNTLDNVGSDPKNQLTPITDVLSQNYPNPFNPTTSITYDLSQNGNVLVEIYNMRGQKIDTLVNDYKEAGIHSIIWNGRNDNEDTVSSGVYFCKLSTSKSVSVKKMILMK